jgi:hypothetical protein
MLTRAKCVACRESFSGSREETFHWLRHHHTLHALQATAIQRFAADQAKRINEECVPVGSGACAS